MPSRLTASDFAVCSDQLIAYFMRRSLAFRSSLLFDLLGKPTHFARELALL